MAWCTGKVLSGICWQPVLSPNGSRLCFYHRKVSLGQLRRSDGSLYPPGWRPAGSPEADDRPSDGWISLTSAVRPLDQLLALDARRELSGGDDLSFLR